MKAPLIRIKLEVESYFLQALMIFTRNTTLSLQFLCQMNAFLRHNAILE